MKPTYRVTDQHGPDVEALGKKLNDYNSDNVALARKQPLSVLLHDDDGALVAGLSGETAWGWLFVRWLWVDKPLWGQGIAGTLLDKAEAEAKARGCIGSHIDTFNPRAAAVYKRQGYETFGEIKEYVADQTRTYLQKRWG